MLFRNMETWDLTELPTKISGCIWNGTDPSEKPGIVMMYAKQNSFP